MKTPNWAETRGYLIALATVAVTCIVWLALTTLIGNRVSSSFFLIAIVFVNRSAGQGPAWFALLLGAIPVTSSQYTRSGLFDPGATSIVAVYFILGTILNYVMQSERTARQTAERNAVVASRQKELLEKEIAERQEAEFKLRTREAQLSGILNNASAAIYLKDADGRYLLSNRRHNELCSPQGQSILGKTTREVFPEEIARSYLEADEQVWRTNAPVDCEEIVLHPDGPHTYRSVKFPVTDETGKMIALGGISTDISDLKDAHEALKAEQALLRNLIQVQENERKLVCYDIHDGMIQSVAGSMMLLEGYEKSQPPSDRSAVVAEVIRNLRLAVNEGRRVIRGVRSAVLDDAGLVPAILDLIDHLSGSELAIEFVHDGNFDQLPKNVETAIYRVTQEALTNVRKHSGSDRVRIELTHCDQIVRVEIRDHGRGFNVKTPRNNALGILGMTERMRLLGGQCSIESEIGSGTRVVAWLHVDPAES